MAEETCKMVIHLNFLDDFLFIKTAHEDFKIKQQIASEQLKMLGPIQKG